MVERPSTWLSLEGWGPVLFVEPSTSAQEVAAFAKSRHRADRQAIAVSPMWPWQRRALFARLRSAGVTTRRFRRLEARELRRRNRFSPDRWWRLPLYVPSLLFVVGQRMVGRGMKLLIVESVAGAPPAAPPDGGDRAPRPTPPSSPAISAAEPSPA